MLISDFFLVRISESFSLAELKPCWYVLWCKVWYNDNKPLGLEYRYGWSPCPKVSGLLMSHGPIWAVPTKEIRRGVFIYPYVKSPSDLRSMAYLWAMIHEDSKAHWRGWWIANTKVNNSSNVEFTSELYKDWEFIVGNNKQKTTHHQGLEGTRTSPGQLDRLDTWMYVLIGVGFRMRLGNLPEVFESVDFGFLFKMCMVTTTLRGITAIVQGLKRRYWGAV